MDFLIKIIHMVSAILLLVSIVTQQQGTGLSATFGGTGGGGFHVTKRGPEKFLFYFTIVVATVFVGSAILSLFF
jgi:protein translocase SecG subunit